MNIEKQFTEIGDYFRKKVLEGDYKFVKCDRILAHIIIDDVYTFKLWIANNPENDFSFYTCLDDEKIFFKHMGFNSIKDRKKGYSQLKKRIDEYRNTVLKKEKLVQFNRLKKELNMECNEK